MTKLISLCSIIAVCAVMAVSIIGCTYHDHYYGQEEMVDEGVVVQERYVVE